MSPPEPVTVGRLAYKQIRSDILLGRLAPGQKLKLEKLRSDYKISNNTLREILNRLTSENLVVAEVARSFEVAPISAANLIEIAELRILLESHAIEKSFKLGDTEWESRVVATHYKLAHTSWDMADRTQAEVQKRYDWEFHSALISACGSQTLIESYSAIFEKYMRYLMIALIFRGSIAANEHDKLLEFALKRDVPSATTIIAEHINGCVAFTLEHWKGELR